MHRVRLYPKATQEERLQFMLDVTRQTHNALLEERRYAWKARGINVTAKMQYAEITALRGEDARFASVYRECVDAVLHRLDLGFAAFFRRAKRGEPAGYPRFKSAARWKQLEFPHGDRALKLDAAQKRVRIPGVGTVPLRKGRTIPAFGALDVRRMTLSAKGTLATPGRNVAAKSGLNRALLDAGFGKLATLIREKAAWAVREIVSIDARYSSQTCGRCLQVDA